MNFFCSSVAKDINWIVWCSYDEAKLIVSTCASYPWHEIRKNRKERKCVKGLYRSCGPSSPKRFVMGNEEGYKSRKWINELVGTGCELVN